MCSVNKMKLHVRCKTPNELEIVYIKWKNSETVGVCEKCWLRICDKDWEIGEGPKLTMEELISDKARGLEGAVETEFKYKGKKFEKENEDKEETLF